MIEHLSLALYLSFAYMHNQDTCEYYTDRKNSMNIIKSAFLDDVNKMKERGEDYKAHEEYLKDLEKRLNDLELKYKDCNKSSN